MIFIALSDAQSVSICKGSSSFQSRGPEEEEKDIGSCEVDAIFIRIFGGILVVRT